ncbi:MAG: Transcriptional regulator, ArsR family [Labilithrix sp.]|nr:Transcriptional regulator, ArsR family [Labilithrix sp.]
MPKDEETRAGTSAFAALADPTRRKILKMLRSRSKTAGEIADAFHLTKPTLSHHFQVLRRAGLVRSERRGTSIVYTLQTNVLEDLATELYELASTTTRSRARGLP